MRVFLGSLGMAACVVGILLVACNGPDSANTEMMTSTPAIEPFSQPPATPLLTLAPTASGAVERDSTSVGNDATVNLTASLDTVHYVVSGETTKEIFDSLEVTGPDTGAAEDGRFTAGFTEANRSHKYQLVVEGAYCMLQSASISLQQVVTLPRHVDATTLNDVQLTRWRDFAEAVAIHEQQHVDIYIDGIEAFQSQLESLGDFADCGSLESAITSVWEITTASTNREQDAFHSSEEQRSLSLREPLRLQIGRNESELDRIRITLDSLLLETDEFKLKLAEIERLVLPFETELNAIRLEYPDLVLPPTVFDTYQQLRSKWDTLNDERNDTVAKLNAVVEQHNETVVCIFQQVHS